MSEQAGPVHGDFCWDELYTNDLDKATEFYTQVVGWTCNAMPMPDGPYHIMNVGERGVCGLMTMPAPMAEHGIPPHWASYIMVTDVDEYLEKATSMGAEVVAPAMEIPNIGRFGFIKDPVGAAVGLYQGTEPTKVAEGDRGDPPAPVSKTIFWHDLMTPDHDKSVEFWTKFMGWTTSVIEPMPDFKLTMFENHGIPICSVVVMTPEQIEHFPPCFSQMIAVDDLDGTINRVVECGGEKCEEPVDVPDWGRFVFMKDPTGAAIGYWQSNQG